MKILSIRCVASLVCVLVLMGCRSTPGDSQVKESVDVSAGDSEFSEVKSNGSTQRGSVHSEPFPIYTPHAYGDLLAGREIPEQRARIDGLVADLSKETVEQSIENLLTNHNQYSLGSTDPMGQRNLEEILSARRAVKVLEALRAMPPAERVLKCRDMFDRAMQLNKDVHDDAFRAREEPGFSAELRAIPVHGIGLAMLATAETGRRDILEEQFMRIDEFRAYLERRVREHRSLYSDAKVRTLIEFCVPDDRLQINVLRLVGLCSGSTDRLSRIDAYYQKMGITGQEVLIVPWNARTTLFEFRVGSPPDTSKGATTYVFHGWPGDSMTRSRHLDRTVVQQARNLVFN